MSVDTRREPPADKRGYLRYRIREESGLPPHGARLRDGDLEAILEQLEAR